jgi:cytochrome c peroxidase
MRWHGLALLSAQFIPDLIDETTFEALWFLVPVDPLSGKEKSRRSRRYRFFSCLVAELAARLYFNKRLSDYRVACAR